MSLYLIIDFSVIIIPLLFSFHPKIKFYKEWKFFLPALFTTALLFIIGDYYFTKEGIWGFNERYVSGINVLNLPIEEVLFFICIPYACVFTYHVIKRQTGQSKSNLLHLFLLFISVLLFIFAVKYIDKKYTVFACISACSVLVLSLIFLPHIPKPFFISFLILLIPFTIVNGILTGTGIDSEIVRYNNSENLGIRFLTIPVEDFGYALSMILMNVFLMEWFKKQLTVK